MLLTFDTYSKLFLFFWALYSFWKKKSVFRNDFFTFKMVLEFCQTVFQVLFVSFFFLFMQATADGLCDRLCFFFFLFLVLLRNALRLAYLVPL